MNSSESELRAQAENLRFTNLPLALNTLWPAGKLVSTDVLPSEIDATQLHMVIDGSFAESDPRRPRRTRAVVIVYKGRIVAERYGVGFSADTPLLGYSMTKTVTNALTGILVRDGKLFVEDSQLFAEWRKSAGLRGNISLDQLLRMTDGLRFRENYENNIATDLNRMLLGTGDVASYAINKPLEAKPGTRWRYSSGTTNIISRLVRDTLEQEPESVYLEFPRKALFEPIGMSSAVLETDAVGTFVGSTSMYATARDWARLGLLYLQDGVWAGRRILPRGWVEYSVTPTAQAPNGEYGAHVWLEVPMPFRAPGGRRPELPKDAYHMVGYGGQFVTVIPSRDLVVVRLGLGRGGGTWDHATFLAEILKATNGEDGQESTGILQ